MSERGDSALGRFKGLLGSKSAASSGILSPAATEQIALKLMHDYEKSGLGWFWSSDAEGRVTYISDCVPERLNRNRDDICGEPFHALFILDRDDDDTIERTLPLIFSARKTFADLAVRAAVEGQETWWSISGRPQYSAGGDFIGYHGNGADVTESRRTQRDASRMAMYDSLTGLANRHRMSQRLNATLTAYRVAKRCCAVMMIDLDRFKQVNDTLGHPAGDELLKQVANRLQRVVTEKGCEIGRLGGDEFQVILPDIDDRGRLGEIAKTIIAMISQPYSIEGSRCVIGASIGIAIAPYDGINSEELIRSADLALYASKGGGRGQFRFYSSDLHSQAEQRRRLEEELRDALGKDQLYMAYQPVVDAQSHRVVGLEALMRWDHPELGSVSPAVFIPIAEDTQLIGPLGEWALRRACDDAAQLPGNIRIAVNVSPAQFANEGLPAIVASALANSQLASDRLELELTESIFLSSGDNTDRMFGALKKLGVRLALDDFGTGYSSLGYLKSAPFDKIKIDQSFIRGVTQPGNRNGAIITAIVSLAEALGLDTTAEGIETLDELAMMTELRVKQIQGFVYEKAITFDRVRELLAAGEWLIDPQGPSKSRSERRTMFRKVGVIHEDHRYEVTMRNLSQTGAMIEGLLDVPLGTAFVVDFGDGQLAVAKVRRSAPDNQGLEFEMPLVDDGAGGLCTRNRVSPYLLAAAGMPLAALPAGQYPLVGNGTGPGGFSLPKFGQANPALKATRAA
ncbi:MAG TPA: EAL domain-containing protein [Novosphingobium sp.]|nr:EAL domain-containing protein [Novosphingobium sp.]